MIGNLSDGVIKPEMTSCFRIRAALRRDPVIGEHMRKKDLEEWLAEQRNEKSVKEKEKTFGELYKEERLQGYSLVGALVNAFKRQIDWNCKFLLENSN